MLSHSQIAATAARLLREEDGPTATEYAVLLALIILVSATVIGVIGTRMQTIYDNIETEIPE